MNVPDIHELLDNHLGPRTAPNPSDPLTSRNPRADQQLPEIISRIGPAKFLHYHAFPLGFEADGRTIRLAFSQHMRKEDIIHNAKVLGKLIQPDDKPSVRVTTLPESQMRFFEKNLQDLQDRLDIQRTVITDADRERAATMVFHDETMEQAARVVPEDVAYNHDVIGLVYDLDHQTLLIAAEDDSTAFIEEMKALIRVQKILVRKMPVRDIREKLKRIYSARKVAVTSPSEIKRVFDAILTEAVQRHANDIAIEYSDANDQGRVRFAIDGLFHPSKQLATLDRETYFRLVNVIREMGEVMPADANECGDGRVDREIGGRPVSLRINTMPYTPGGGQRVAMRVISQLIELRRLDDLGLTKRTYRQFERAMKRPGAFNVIAGPTGEGKTTTGYTLLKTFVDFNERNIMSLEDPIECPIAGINQFLVKGDERAYEETGKGNTFARLLRAAVRAYPHYIYLGEIRDDETASEAMRAATTGISLLSTTHANDAVQALNRLKAFNVSRFDLAQNLKMSASQRLLRRLCDNCKTRTKMISKEAKALAFAFQVDLITLYSPNTGGCRHCDGTGYRDRIAAFEVLEVNAAVAEAIENPNVGSVGIAQVAVENGYRPMAVAALEHLADGLTSEEAIAAKLSFTDALRYLRPNTPRVSYSDPDEQVEIDTDDAGRTDLLRGSDAA